MIKNSNGVYEMCADDFKDNKEWAKYQANKDVPGSEFMLTSGVMLKSKAIIK